MMYEMITSKFSKKFWGILLSLLLAIGMGGGYLLNSNIAYGAGIDVGANPTPKVDIAVNVPADYPGTFLEFKEELTQKLIDRGMDPGSFRITTTAVTIDTTDTEGWYVYDHYYNDDAYNKLNLSDEQKLKQPNRAADNSCADGPKPSTIDDYFKNNTNTTNNTCKYFNKHIYSYTDDEGKASMVFAGYGTNALSDYMIYPAASNSRRNFSFDINPAVIDAHTLSGFGFFLNAGIANNKLSGYALYFPCSGSGSSSTVGSGQIMKIANLDPNAATISGTPVISGLDMGIKKGEKYRLTVELNKDSVTIQYQQYDGSGNPGAIRDLVRDFNLDDTGFNGFGPMVNYKSHGCQSLSIMKYMDLEMSYEASAFDALKNVQYYEGAEQKYFINLTGTNNNPGIPEETLYGKPNQNYHDGINRMNENEIFYISNTDDGQIVTDSTKGSDGTLTHQGLGSANGFYASGDGYTQQIAEYIYTNYRDGVKFQKAEVDSALPLANFYVRKAESDEQLMTIHLQHLVNTHGTVAVNIFDKSKTGTLSGENGKLAKWTLSVTDPNNTVVSTQTVTNPSQLENYVFTEGSIPGRYTLTLIVEDNSGNVSKDFSTYVTAFKDVKVPYIEGENTGRNIATITLTDTGQGIDEDGITFIEDDRGSGVAAYWVTNSKTAEPTDDDWIELPFAQHQFSFEQEIENTEPLVIWVKDECSNIGNKAVFQPTHVRVEDNDGNPIDDYYVIGEKPIIVLPPDEEVPDPDDPENEKFSGWVTGGNDDPVTPGTTPTPDNNEIIIRPSYSTDKAKIIYLANGGQLAPGVDSEQEVVSGASILTKIKDQNIIPTRTGYTFIGWKLLDTDNANSAADSTYINNTSHVATVTDQVAKAIRSEDDSVVIREKYYLVAQWEVAKHALKFDANGGSLGRARGVDDVVYNTDLATVSGIPTSGRELPSRAGYFFRGWSETSQNDLNTIFKLANGYTHAAVAAPTMPDADKTIYAVWEKDTSKFLVHFDSNGGSSINDQDYLINPSATDAKVYNTFMKPSRTGYIFKGWFEKTGTNEDGTPQFGATEYTGGEPFIQKADHTFVAKWEPKNDTKYTVDYYVNSGNKDAQGNYIYTKVNSLDDGTNPTKTYTSKTENKVSVANSDKTSELTTGGATYWYNADNANNVLEGTVTGSPALSLKLYYDRYFDVEANKCGNKKGNITVPSNIKEGTSPTISWKADEGNHVKRVIVDGVVRDDLLTANEFTFSDPFFENHSIDVYFEETTSDTPAPKPVDPDPTDPVVNETVYQVTTSINGCGDGSATITPTKRLTAGSDYTVTWTLPEDYWVTDVLVDGVSQGQDMPYVDLKGIQTDHTVVVEVSKLPSLGGATTDNYYTITVNKYGGSSDDGIVISPSQTAKEGEKCPITFDGSAAKNGYSIYQVKIDGEIVKAGKKNTTITLSGKNAKDHVVDVYIKKDDIDQPTFKEEEMVKVTTQVVGGPGTISGGAALNKGEDYNVSWNVNQVEDPTDSNYTYYEIESVEVKQGETTVPVDLTDTQHSFTNLNEDATVTVKLKPVMHDVIVKTYGDVNVNKLSKTLWHLQSYTEIEGLANTGSFMAFVVVDGKVVYNAPEKPVSATTEAQAQAQAVQDNSAISENNASSETATNAVNNNAAVDNNANGASEVTEPEEPAQEVATPEEVNEAQEQSDSAIEALALDEIQMRDAEAADDETAYTHQEGAGTHKVDVNGLTQNHVIEYYALKNDAEMPKVPDDPDGKKEVLDDIKDKHFSDINVSIVDADGNSVAGTSINGIGGVENGTDRNVTWTVPNGYKVDSVTLNGQEVTADGSYNFTDVQGNQNLVVKVSSTIPKSDPTPGDFRVNSYDVTTSLQGGFGEISGAGTYDENKPATVTWSAGDADHPDYVVKYVFVDGKLDPIALEAGEAKFTDNKDHTVVVVVEHKDKTPTNIDKDGDGKPDTNIDPDGDGKPDINIDKDGDGEPDINIVPPKKDENDNPIPVDPEKDKPVVNVDTDGDGEPDVNIDTDGDGKPDINIVDEDGDGKPDPVDPKDPKKPNVNVDTDGDGKPDINKDTTGDGKPDTDIDTDGDGKPDLNEDNDGDGVPDTDVDTDGDGKPDVNVDVDGDGTPDINIVDEDGDGTPDPVKPGTKPTPTINVDTNGDGIPDENIDRNYGDEFYWKWVDAELAKQNSNSDNPSPDNPADNSKDKNDKSKKSKSSKTGDMTAPITGGIALIALLSGLVLVLARRRKEN